MKALTIRNPYSHLIITPQNQLPEGAIHKRVENRSWIPKSILMRVPFAIHAGVSMDWFRFGDWPLDLPRKAKRSDVPQMAFGAVVGIAVISHCFHVNQIRTGQVPAEYQWLCDHKHVSGPYCFVLDNVVAMEHPVPCVGQQKFFTLPSSVEARVMDQLGIGMTSAEFVECERIQATVGDDVWLDEQEWRRLESGRIMYIDRITGKQLQPNQCGLLDYGRNGGKYRHIRLLSVMLRQAY